MYNTILDILQVRFCTKIDKIVQNLTIELILRKILDILQPKSSEQSTMNERHLGR